MKKWTRRILLFLFWLPFAMWLFTFVVTFAVAFDVGNSYLGVASADWEFHFFAGGSPRAQGSFLQINHPGTKFYFKPIASDVIDRVIRYGFERPYYFNRQHPIYERTDLVIPYWILMAFNLVIGLAARGESPETRLKIPEFPKSQKRGG